MECKVRGRREDGGPAQLFPHRPAHYSAPRRAASVGAHWDWDWTWAASARGRQGTYVRAGLSVPVVTRRPPCHGHRRCRSNVHRGGSGTGVSARAPIMTRLVRLVASRRVLHVYYYKRWFRCPYH